MPHQRGRRCSKSAICYRQPSDACTGVNVCLGYVSLCNQAVCTPTMCQLPRAPLAARTEQRTHLSSRWQEHCLWDALLLCCPTRRAHPVVLGRHLHALHTEDQLTPSQTRTAGCRTSSLARCRSFEHTPTSALQLRCVCADKKLAILLKAVYHHLKVVYREIHREHDLVRRAGHNRVGIGERGK